jgi:hypothetical protein
MSVDDQEQSGRKRRAERVPELKGGSEMREEYHSRATRRRIRWRRTWGDGNGAMAARIVVNERHCPKGAGAVGILKPMFAVALGWAQSSFNCFSYYSNLFQHCNSNKKPSHVQKCSNFAWC